MKLTYKIGSEMQEINDLYFEVKDKDQDYFERNEQEIASKQLLLWIRLIKWRMHANKKQKEKITIIYNVFWEYYKRRKNLSKYNITSKDFIEKINKHNSFMEYLEVESDIQKLTEAFYLDLSQASGKALDVWVYLYWDSSKALRKLGVEALYEFMVDFRALISTFDELEVVS